MNPNMCNLCVCARSTIRHTPTMNCNVRAHRASYYSLRDSGALPTIVSVINDSLVVVIHDCSYALACTKIVIKKCQSSQQVIQTKSYGNFVNAQSIPGTCNLKSRFTSVTLIDAHSNRHTLSYSTLVCVLINLRSF